MSGVSSCSICGIASPVVQEGGMSTGKGKGYNRAHIACAAQNVIWACNNNNHNNKSITF